MFQGATKRVVNMKGARKHDDRKVIFIGTARSIKLTMMCSMTLLPFL